MALVESGTCHYTLAVWLLAEERLPGSTSGRMAGWSATGRGSARPADRQPPVTGGHVPRTPVVHSPACAPQSHAAAHAPSWSTRASKAACRRP